MAGRYLSLTEQEEIALGLAQKLPQAEIARRLGRPASTVSREIARNSTRGRYRYRAVAAQETGRGARTAAQAAKLAVNGQLRALGTGQAGGGLVAGAGQLGGW